MNGSPLRPLSPPPPLPRRGAGVGGVRRTGWVGAGVGSSPGFYPGFGARRQSLGFARDKANTLSRWF
jgi:hypothetical protein